MKKVKKRNNLIVCLFGGIVVLCIVIAILISNDSLVSNAKKTISNIELMDLYKNELKNYIPESGNDVQLLYAIVDINKDDILEMIIKTGNTEATYQYIFYTYDENNSYYAYDNYLVYAGTIDGGHTSLYEMKQGEYLLSSYAHMSAEIVSYLTLENGWIVDRRISQKINVDNYQEGDNYIEFNDYQDMSVFDSYK